ncbi:hypothetical protein VNO80_01176 [Phaseolus coccineus]|uniref:Uncharacterized protein n=1 Tax=Phaseolus coccineus TaxID=3886 RepID=A0AAN9RMK1_PHACN
MLPVSRIKLSIEKCSLLQRRCQRKDRQIWVKICHMPDWLGETAPFHGFKFNFEYDLNSLNFTWKPFHRACLQEIVIYCTLAAELQGQMVEEVRTRSEMAECSNKEKGEKGNKIDPLHCLQLHLKNFIVSYFTSQ